MSYALDYASQDEDPPIDAEAAKAGGIDVVIVRGNYSTWKDPTAARDRDPIRKAGMVFGSTMAVDYSANAPSAMSQVAAYKIGAGLIPGTDLPPWIDIEFQSIAHTGRTRVQLGSFIGDIVKAISDAFGVSPGAYDSTRVLDTDDTDTLHGAADIAITGLAQWLAHYGFPYHATNVLETASRVPSPPTPAVVGHDPDGWVLHQLAGDARNLPGIRQADVSRWNLSPMYGPTRSKWILDRLRPINMVAYANGPIGVGLKAYQLSKNLTADAILGPRTFAALGWERIA